MADNSGPVPPQQGGPYQPYPPQQPGPYPPAGQYPPPYPGQQAGGYPGQQPGGQYPGPQYPQQGGHYPPPPPKGGSKAGLIIASVVGAVVLIAGGIFAVTQLGGDDKPTAGGSSSTEPSAPAGSPEPSASDSPSAVPACNGCFPGVKLATLTAGLKAKGYLCKVDGSDYKCSKNDGDQMVGISLDYKDKTLVRRISITAFKGGKDDYPQGEEQAVATLKADIPRIVPLVVKDPSIAQKVTAFLTGRAGVRSDSKVGQYRVSTEPVDSITVRGKSGLTVTSWNSWAYIEGPSAY